MPHFSSAERFALCDRPGCDDDEAIAKRASDVIATFLIARLTQRSGS